MSEAKYQTGLRKRIQKRIPGCEIVKNDAQLRQGILDLTVFVGPKWGMLEVKKSADAPVQPNQEYYVDHFNDMGFASFISPENEEEVLSALEQALAS